MICLGQIVMVILNQIQISNNLKVKYHNQIVPFLEDLVSPIRLFQSHQLRLNRIKEKNKYWK